MKIVNDEQKITVSVFVERAQSKHAWRLGHFGDVSFKVRLKVLSNLLPIYDIDSIFKESPLNTHSTNLLNKSGLADTISSANLKVFCLFFAAELLEYFVDFLPLSINTRNRVIFDFKVKINIVCFAKSRR